MKRKLISTLLVLAMTVTSMQLPALASNSNTDNFGQETVTETILPQPTATIDSDLISVVEPTTLPTVMPMASVAPTVAPTATAVPTLVPTTTPKGSSKIKVLNDETDLTSDLTEASVTISTSGKYVINNITTANCITVASGTKNVEITLNNVNITSTTLAPIKVESGAEVVIHLQGENSLAAPNYYAGIAVYANDTSSNYGILTIDGDGTLIAKGGSTHGPGIGTNKVNIDQSSGISGKIIINSGNITASGGLGAAGIGGAFNSNTCGEIIINGGIITATGGLWAAGIGGARQKANGLITVNGGYIKATGNSTVGIGAGNQGTGGSDVIINGGSINSTVASNAKDKFGNKISQIILTMPQGIGVANKLVKIGTWTATTDENGKLYPYISQDTQSFTVEYNNKIYYVNNITSETTEYELVEYSGSACVCTTDNASISLQVPESVTVNKLVGQKSVKATTQFVHANECTYPIHGETTNYEVSVDGVTDDVSSYAKISDGYLIVYYAAAGKTVNLKTTVTNNQIEYTDIKNIQIIGDDSSRFDLSDGTITIKKNDSQADMMDVKVGSNVYTISSATKVYISQSTETTTNTIGVSESATVVIEDVNIKTIGKSVITVGDGVNLNLELSGNNEIYAVNSATISGISSSSSMTITGDGSLTTTSENGAGIGRLKQLTIESGTVIANGGNGGAGIGGANDGAGMYVVVNGGKVYATGDGNASGIGGGSSISSGIGGTFIMNGGMVVAKSNGTGSGIGGGGKPSVPGTITINGGNVNSRFYSAPKNLNGDTLYLVTLSVEGITGEADVSYSVGDDETQKIQTSTDKEGKLYLYVPNGKQWIRVYKDENTYYKYITINRNGVNSGECVLNPIAKLNSFRISGQIGETEIDEENGKVKITVPYNINLNYVVPIVDYQGCDSSPSKGNKIDFLNDMHTAEYTIIGDNKEEKKYDITLTLENEPSELTASVYDISQGNISFSWDSGDYVDFGGTRYTTNPLGYIITGTTTENTVKIDYADNDLPQITLRDVNIASKNIGVSPFTISKNANLVIDGECSISSINSNAINLINSYSVDGGVNVNITGDGKLNVQGGTSSAAVVANVGTKLKITGPTTTISGGLGANALTGDGEFITDSITNMHLVNNSTPTIQPKNAGGESLYQLTVNIDAADKTESTCVYNDITYYVGENATFYLMVPNGEQDMSVVYNNNTYTGSGTVDGAEKTIIIKTITVENVSYDSSVLTYAGGSVDFTVTGNLVAGNVKIRLKPNREGYPTVEGTVLDKSGSNIASIEVPNNPSYESAVTYTVYYVINDTEYELIPKIVVDRNTTVCQIQSFKLAGQVGDEVINETEDNKTITITMPYDHVFQNYYTPKELKYIGRGISPTVDTPIAYVDMKTYLRAYYTVTARDNETTSRYTVRIYREPTPKITALSFRNPSTSEGGKITVTMRGTALSSINKAEKAENKNVYIYSDDGIEPVKAEYQEASGVYVAEVNIPANTSDMEDSSYVLKAKIGNTEQTEINPAVSTVKVPRRARSITGIDSFSITGQIGETEITNDAKINIVMPYDADITNVLPQIILEDMYATYSPVNEQDFSSSVLYTVIAEDKTEKEYTVNVTKQETPVANSIEFENPKYSGAGRVQVKINGQHLENAVNAMNVSKLIEVSGVLTSSGNNSDKIEAGYAEKDENGNFIAEITVPQNNDDFQKEYTLSVKIGDTVQTITGTKVLTVPRKEKNTKEITDFVLVDKQSAITIADNRIYLYVPYNTDLNSITPKIYHTGISCLPEGPQNFNNIVTYTVKAEDDSYSVYEIHAMRSGSAKVDSITKNSPETFNDTQITVDINGKFVPYLKDAITMDIMKISAVPRDGGDAVDGVITYDDSVYGGHATAAISLPINDSSNPKIYDIKITINDIEQSIGLSGVISVPRRTSRAITDFRINGQTGTTEIIEDEVNGNKIKFKIPYNSDITSLTPAIKIDGDDYTPKTAQNFENPVTYTVSAKNDTDRTYTVTAEREGEAQINSVTVTGTPTTFKGKTINVDITGIFFYEAAIRAVPVGDGEPIEGTITSFEEGKASATIVIPDNLSTTDDKQYELRFDVDNDKNLSSSYAQRITVPRRKTREIKNLTINNQVGIATITDTDIYVQIKYDSDISKVTPSISIDGDSYSPEGEQNFDNPTQSLVYTVSAADDTDRQYTVHIARSGNPTIDRLSYMSPSTYKGGEVVVNFKGIFFDSAEISAVSEDGEKINGTITSFEPGDVMAKLQIPTNYDTENDKTYQIKFVLDGVITSYIGGTDITVPRRKTRTISSFTLPEIQEGETVIDGTDIYINVPYHLDISSVVPEITYDADDVMPKTAQNFGDTEHDVKYTLSARQDDDIVYTVHITRIGEDPYIKSFTVNKQSEDTVYDKDTIYVKLPSNAKIKEVEPIVEFEGTDYSPKGPQDFSDSNKNPVVYTVVNKYGIERKYNVTIEKKKTSGNNNNNSSTTPKPSPTVEPTVEPTEKPIAKPTPSVTPKPMSEPYINGYEVNGELLFMPNNPMNRAEVAKILSSLDKNFDEASTYLNVFADVSENTWYENYIGFAFQQGYISGYEDKIYRPEAMITRAEFVTIISRYIEVTPLEDTDKFSDIHNFDWCRGYINALAEMGIVSGYNDGTFRPDEMITRAEAVAIINRATERTISSEILNTLNCPFVDINSEHWAYDEILKASCEY